MGHTTSAFKPCHVMNTSTHKICIFVQVKFCAAFLIREVQLPKHSDDSDVGVYEFQAVRQSRSTCFMLFPIYAERGMQARDINLAAMMQRLLPALSLSKRRNHFPALFAPTPPIFGTVCEKWGSESVFLPFNFPDMYLQSHTL